jgi:hypothetical protein
MGCCDGDLFNCSTIQPLAADWRWRNSNNVDYQFFFWRRIKTHIGNEAYRHLAGLASDTRIHFGVVLLLIIWLVASGLIERYQAMRIGPPTQTERVSEAKDQWPLPTKDELKELSRQLRDVGIAGKRVQMSYGDPADKSLAVLIGQAFSNADAFPGIGEEGITFGISIQVNDEMKPAADIFSKFCEDKLGTKARVRLIQASSPYLIITIGRPAFK